MSRTIGAGTSSTTRRWSRSSYRLHWHFVFCCGDELKKGLGSSPLSRCHGSRSPLDPQRVLIVSRRTQTNVALAGIGFSLWL
jgi:hypothetical protein